MSDIIGKRESGLNIPPYTEEELVKHKIRDSVFTNLFADKKYLLQLYQALHPEDTSVVSG